MKLLVFESLVDLLVLLGAGFGAVVLTGAGLLAEQAALQSILSGQPVLGVWEVVVGAVLLFFGVYLFGHQQFWRRLQRIRHAR